MILNKDSVLASAIQKTCSLFVIQFVNGLLKLKTVFFFNIDVGGARASFSPAPLLWGVRKRGRMTFQTRSLRYFFRTGFKIIFVANLNGAIIKNHSFQTRAVICFELFGGPR